MKNKKVIGLLLSLVLVLGVALPGTLATSTDTEDTGSEFSIGTMGENTETPLEDAENNDTTSTATEPSDDSAPVCTCGTEDGIHAESCALYVAPSDPVCSCGTEDGTHAEDCPLYVAPDDPVCSCGTENGTHAEGCPLYVAPVTPELPEAPTHIDTCVEGCTGENCECSCHELSLYERLMACTTLEEIDLILDAATDEEFASLTDEENMEIDAYIESLEPDPLPAVVIEESNDETVVSEIVYPTVSFTNVAPFGDPVIGGAN